MRLSFETRTDGPPDGWEAFLESRGGSIFHSPVWAAYLEASQGLHPIYVTGRDEAGGTVGGALAFLSHSRRPVLRGILRDLLLESHPFPHGAGPELASALVAGVEQVGRGLGCATVRIGSYMSGTSEFLPSKHGYAEEGRVEFTVDLTRDRDTIWRAVAKDQRERIRKLGREGLRCEEGHDPEDLRELRAAREATREKRASQGLGYDLDADDAFYERLHEHLVRRGAARLFLARSEGKTVAALFFAAYQGRAYSVFSGSSPEGYRMGAQSALYWHALESLQDAGFRELNRGGVPASASVEGDPLHGIYRFKLRLGTEPRPCRSGFKVLSPLRHRVASLRGLLRAWR
ncbi:MAG TPA: GNAT family N-acetyltransferase [Candidatus Eisenbacteria bacterium]